MRRKNRSRESHDPRNEVGIIRISIIRGHNKAAIGARRRVTPLGFSSRFATFADLLLFVRRLHLLLLTHPRSRPSDFAVPPLVPPLYLPSSLIKGTNYATSSRPSFSGFLPISFSPPPPPGRYFPPLFGSK